MSIVTNTDIYVEICPGRSLLIYSVKVWKYYLLYYEYGYNEFTAITKKFSPRLQNTIIFYIYEQKYFFGKNIFQLT